MVLSLQLFILGTLVNIVFSSTNVICDMLFHKVTSALPNPQRASRFAQRLGGSILITLGFNVALNWH